MNWTTNHTPAMAVYNHRATAETPIGKIIIDWKGWGERPVYDVSSEGYHIASTYDLDSAKQAAKNYLLKLKN